MNRVAPLTIAIVSSLLWLALPPAALAQPREKGFAEFGVGPAAFDSTPPTQGGNEGTFAVGYIFLGGWLNPRWLVGVDLGAAGSDVSGQVLPVWFSGVVSHYPRATSGFHVKGSVGISEATLDIVDEFGETDFAELGTGLSLMAGTGWDVHLWRRLWLTPAVNIRYGRPGDLVVAGRTTVRGWRYHTVDFTVGIRFD